MSEAREFEEEYRRGYLDGYTAALRDVDAYDLGKATEFLVQHLNEWKHCMPIDWRILPPKLEDL